MYIGAFLSENFALIQTSAPEWVGYLSVWGTGGQGVFLHGDIGGCTWEHNKMERDTKLTVAKNRNAFLVTHLTSQPLPLPLPPPFYTPFSTPIFPVCMPASAALGLAMPAVKEQTGHSWFIVGGFPKVLGKPPPGT